MKLTLFASALIALTASAHPLFLQEISGTFDEALGSVQHALQSEYSTTELKYEICDESSNTFHLESLKISPDPPQKGQKLIISLVGELNTEVAMGTSLEVSVKFMRIPILKRQLDLCEELAKVADAPAKCPITPGRKEWTYTVDLPESAPNGKYSADVKIKDQTGQQVFCTKASMDI
jgi:hypothetical protein